MLPKAEALTHDLAVQMFVRAKLSLLNAKRGLMNYTKGEDHSEAV